MARAYLRLDPDFFDRKAIDQKYPAGAIAALVGTLCHAEHQPRRGRFRDTRVLKALLGPHAKWIEYLVERGDLSKHGAELYVDGWDEWQEGDWKVGERVRRIRNRRGVTAGVTVDVTPDVTVETESPVTVGTVYTPSDGGRQSVIDGGGGKRKAEASPPNPPRDRGGRKRDRSNGVDPSQYEARTITDDDLTEDGELPDWARAPQARAG